MTQPGFARRCSSVRLAPPPPRPAQQPSRAYHFAMPAAPRACRRPGVRTPSRSSGPPGAAWPRVRERYREPAAESRRNSALHDRGPGRRAPPGCPAAPGAGSRGSPRARPDERTPLAPAGGARPRAHTRHASRRPPARVFLQRPVIAVGDRVARLNLIGLEALPPGVELIDGDRLDEVALPGEQRVDVLQRLTDTRAQPLNRLIVAGVAVHGRLSRAHECGVLHLQHPRVFVQLVQILVCPCQPFGVLRVQPPGEYALEMLQPRLLRGTFRTTGMF